MSWWIAIPREGWRKAVTDEQARLMTSQFGKSHRLATGPNTVQEDAGEARRRRSRLDMVTDLDRRKTA